MMDARLGGTRTNKQNRNDVFWLATIVILITFISCAVIHHTDLRQRLVGARMRIALSAAIYRKSLRMSKRAVTQTSAGNVVNLLSNDVSRLDYGFIFVHFIWILPLQGNLNLFSNTHSPIPHSLFFFFFISLGYNKFLFSASACKKNLCVRVFSFILRQKKKGELGRVKVKTEKFLFLPACLICYLIWREVKYAAIVGVVGLLVKTIPIQTGLSKISSILRYTIIYIQVEIDRFFSLSRL
jgi:ABC transporter transmembrane region